MIEASKWHYANSSTISDSDKTNLEILKDFNIRKKLEEHKREISRLSNALAQNNSQQNNLQQSEHPQQNNLQQSEHPQQNNLQQNNLQQNNLQQTRYPQQMEHSQQNNLQQTPISLTPKYVDFTRPFENTWTKPPENTRLPIPGKQTTQVSDKKMQDDKLIQELEQKIAAMSAKIGNNDHAVDFPKNNHVRKSRKEKKEMNRRGKELVSAISRINWENFLQDLYDYCYD
jgi:hypothetical protein